MCLTIRMRQPWLFYCSDTILVNRFQYFVSIESSYDQHISIHIDDTIELWKQFIKKESEVCCSRKMNFLFKSRAYGFRIYRKKRYGMMSSFLVQYGTYLCSCLIREIITDDMQMYNLLYSTEQRTRQDERRLDHIIISYEDNISWSIFIHFYVIIDK